MRSIDEWMESRGNEDTSTFTPADKRRYSLNDAVAIPGLYSKRSNLGPDPKDVELKFAGSSIKLRANGDVVVAAANDMFFTANAITLTANDVEVTSNTLTHNGTDVGDTHKHDGSPTAPNGIISDTGAPI
jgi:hypothetical protein